MTFEIVDIKDAYILGFCIATDNNFEENTSIDLNTQISLQDNVSNKKKKRYFL